MALAAAAIVTSVVFGAVVGWGLSRNPADRLASLTATTVTCVVGLFVLATSPESGSELAVAAGSMTLGGASATVALALTGGRTLR
jgi:protein-S-isoprenylcysteine O-methyltransferase Ste14